MARGWESKSVESQIDDARAGADRGRDLTLQERELERKRAGIELSRQRVLQDLELARSDLRRASLQQALAFLDDELRKLAESAESTAEPTV